MRRGSLVLGLLLVWTLPACSDATTSTDARPADSKGADVQAVDASEDAPAGDAAAADSTPLDATTGDATVVDAAAAVSCLQGMGTPCPGGLTCECCGSIGPSPICICSRKCTSASDCGGTGLPECNKAPAEAEGICTPPGYNCCWLCQ